MGFKQKIKVNLIGALTANLYRKKNGGSPELIQEVKDGELIEVEAGGMIGDVLAWFVRVFRFGKTKDSNLLVIRTIEGENVLPVVSLTGPSTIDLTKEVAFQVSASDSDGTIVWWQLEYGDGQKVSGNGVPPTILKYTYTAIGRYTAKITVRDDDGGTATDTHAITVREVYPIITDVTVSGYNATVVWSIADGSPNNSTSTWQLEYSVNGGAWRVNHGGGSPRTISIESLETGKVRFRVKRVSTPATGYSNVYEIDYTTPKAFLNCSIVDLLDSDPYGDVAPESGTVCVTGGVYTGNVYVEQKYKNAIAEGVQLYIDQTHELTATNVRLYGNENMKKRVPNGAKLVRFYNAQADTVWDVDASTGKIKGAASRQCR